ncbi:Putative collagen-binding domain of a collagenase [Chitinophaga sp. CF118]|uniref:glycoside hydrolase family 140 protein n=1 Tax=Chitinophaga sp. CF118 TaxID=1884367 RepID=UPI0008EE8678|nr:glycoside hydrolase family 140 protein [Chitinophaga sp. CF118]SFE17000.1 Putative collagen-binding domain of a collagenase [Chitinophaga sp. CF118]
MLNKIIAIAFIIFFSLNAHSQQALSVSKNNHYLQTSDGKPFFWLGDTGWLLFTKLTTKQADQYLKDRQQKGFNVIQVMILPALTAKDVYGDSALINMNVAHQSSTGYWNHVDTVIDMAAARGLYMALVPVWGGNVKSGLVSEKDAVTYAAFLAKRYAGKPNIIWLNGGDIKGSDSIAVWKAIGSTLYKEDKHHLITFHPRGRMQSSDWFHKDAWLAFNMFQSGHQTYAQDTTQKSYGEDNWKYVMADYRRIPVKPVIDGEPSYEGIPHGLHDTLAPRWTADDVRRYGYWSVFAGAFGYTYGNNSVMQMHRPEDGRGVYGVKEYWSDAIQAPGAAQMLYLKKLMLSHSYFDRIPDQSLIAAGEGKQYERLLATRGKDYAFIYTYTGRNISVNMGHISGKNVKASWYNPRDGSSKEIGTYSNKGVMVFDPPGEQQNGNDWVLVIDKI